MKPRITLLGSHHDKLVDYFEGHPNGHERAAIVLFRRISRSVKGLDDSDRFLSCEVIFFENDWITDSSPTHIDFVKAPFREIYRRCAEEDLTFGFLHNHPTGYPDFSERDSANEISLLKGLVNRNGNKSILVSMIWTNHIWKARVRHGSDIQSSVESRHIIVLGSHLKIFSSNNLEAIESEILARQFAAFGAPFSKKLNSLRVVIAGAGGTGSPVASLLARSGVGELVIIDFDKLEKTNLNRVRGAGLQDVGKNKAEIQRDFINALGLPCKAVSVDACIDTSYEAISALSTADLVFGCTDDWAGRDVLNKAVYFYLIPLIDLGLGGDIQVGENGEPVIKRHSGRISCVLPESNSCLYCQKVINADKIAAQLAVRADPVRAKKDQEDGYLQGAEEQAPGVGPFTGATADFAIATLFDLVKPFRNLGPELTRNLIFIDFVKLRIKSHEVNPDVDCPYCQDKQYLAMREEHYLLGRPAIMPKES